MILNPQPAKQFYIDFAGLMLRNTNAHTKTGHPGLSSVW